MKKNIQKTNKKEVFEKKIEENYDDKKLGSIIDRLRVDCEIYEEIFEKQNELYRKLKKKK